MQKKVLAIVMTGLMIAGCAPATMQGVREQSKDKETFVVEQNYQAAYRTVLNNAQRCYQTFVGMNVQGQLYTDLKTGEISVANHSAFGVDTYVTIDIKAVDEKSSEVTTYIGTSTWTRARISVRAWLQSGSKECRS